MKKVIIKIATLFAHVYSDRRLLVMLSWKDFKRRFAGSYFGTVWAFAQPLLTMLVYWVVFQFGFKSSDVGNDPFVLWFMCGIVPWLYISETIFSSSNSLLEYSYLVKKVVFNIDILPLVKIFSAAYIHICFLMLLIIVCCALGYWPTPYICQLFYYFLATVVLLYAISLISSAIMVFFRDLGQVINILLLMGMWGTPVAWSVSIVPEKYHFIVKLNPFFYLVEGYRDTFLGRAWFWEKYMQTTYYWIVVLIMLLAGAVIFCRLKPHFSDVL